MSMSALLVAFTCAITGAKPHPSLDQMAKEERGWTLPCGLEHSLGVPSDPELKAVRAEAKEYEDNTNLRFVWMNLDARKTIRQFLTKHPISCADEASQLRTEALEIASARVDQYIPLKRKKRFSELLIQAVRENPSMVSAPVTQSQEASPTRPLPSPPRCDTTGLLAAQARLDSLSILATAKRDTFNMARSRDSERLGLVGSMGRLNVETHSLEALARSQQDRVEQIAGSCPGQTLVPKP